MERQPLAAQAPAPSRGQILELQPIFVPIFGCPEEKAKTQDWPLQNQDCWQLLDQRTAASERDPSPARSHWPKPISRSLQGKEEDCGVWIICYSIMFKKVSKDFLSSVAGVSVGAALGLALHLAGPLAEKQEKTQKLQISGRKQEKSDTFKAAES